MIHHFTHPIRGGLFVHPPVDPHRYVSKERERKKKVISLGRLWFFSIIILYSFPSFFPWHISTHGGFFFGWKKANRGE